MKDVFLSHASPDKQAFVIPFAQRLAEAGISYWLDEAEVGWGDKISASIGKGLSQSKFVVVFLTPAFLGRNWTETELSAALSRENAEGRTVVLPIVTDEPHKLLAQYPLLRDKRYLEWRDTPEAIVAELQSLILKTRMGSKEKSYLNDELTGVFNRRCICDLLARRIDDAQNQHTVLSLLLVDIDHFKIINDLHGHSFGDQVLIETAKRLAATIDDNVSIGRLGGDEFLLITDLADLPSVARLAARLMQALSEPMTIAEQNLSLTATIGISQYPKSGQDPHELLRTADIAVYRGKQQGRHRVVVYEAELDLREGL